MLQDLGEMEEIKGFQFNVLPWSSYVLIGLKVVPDSG